MIERNTNIIGFVGRRRAGKDTAATILNKHGYQTVKFAGALKEMLRAYLTYVGSNKTAIEARIEGDAKEIPCAFLGNQTPRYAMQTLGTEWGRDIMSPDIWVNACVARCLQFPKVVVTDVRFPNEVAALQNLGATIVRITRDPATGDSHVSETGVDDLTSDYDINNKGSIEELHFAIERLIGK